MFSRAAMGPIDYAAGCIVGNKILTGIEELGPDGLRDAYMRGIAEVARFVGVARSEVERVVPLDHAAAVEARLRSSHPTALAAWRSHAGQFGFLDGMTALTVDGRRTDIGLVLERVAGKVRHDLELAQPLEALSVDMTAWAEVVTRTEAMLQDLSWLSAALRRRVLKRVLFAVFVLTTLFGVTGTIVWIRIARDEVSTKIAAAGICEAESLTAEDLSWATKDQRAEVTRKIDECKAERQREAERVRQEEEKRERERKAQEVVLARETACGDLATDVEKGSLSDGSKTTAGTSAAFLDRVAKNALEPVDVGPEEPTFPCGDTPAKKRLEAKYAEALLIDPMLWARRSDPSPYAQKVVAAKKETVPHNVLIGLADNAERTATAGLSGGDKATIVRAKRLCAFATAIGIPGQKSCRAIESFAVP